MTRGQPHSVSRARLVLHLNAGPSKWLAVPRAQISQFGAALRASRQTQAGGHSGGYTRGLPLAVGYVLRSARRVRDARACRPRRRHHAVPGAASGGPAPGAGGAGIDLDGDGWHGWSLLGSGDDAVATLQGLRTRQDAGQRTPERADSCRMRGGEFREIEGALPWPYWMPSG